MGVLVLDKTNVEALKYIFGQQMPSKWLRLRSKMVKVFDQYYFKELEPRELNE